jgi:small subunit ribosomal protein S11
MSYKKKPKKQKQRITEAIAHVKSTFNNTIVSITTMEGDVLFRASSGSLGFKGSRKSTPFAAGQIGGTLSKLIQGIGVKDVEVNMQGPGSGRDSFVRALQGAGISIRKLRDVTPLPHNGCRPSKKRRV